KRRYRNRAQFDRPHVRSLAGLEGARLESKPVIGIASRIEAVHDAQIILIAPTLFCYLNTLNFTWFPVRKIYVYQNVPRPAGFDELADETGAMLHGRLPMDLLRVFPINGK